MHHAAMPDRTRSSQPAIVKAILVAARTVEPGRRPASGGPGRRAGALPRHRRRLLVEGRLPGDVMLEWDALGLPVGLQWPAECQTDAEMVLKLERSPDGAWTGTLLRYSDTRGQHGCRIRPIALSDRAGHAIFDSYRLGATLMAPIAAMHLAEHSRIRS